MHTSTHTYNMLVLASNKLQQDQRLLVGVGGNNNNAAAPVLPAQHTQSQSFMDAAKNCTMLQPSGPNLYYMGPLQGKIRCTQKLFPTNSGIRPVCKRQAQSATPTPSDAATGCMAISRIRIQPTTTHNPQTRMCAGEQWNILKTPYKGRTRRPHIFQHWLGSVHINTASHHTSSLSNNTQAHPASKAATTYATRVPPTSSQRRFHSLTGTLSSLDNTADTSQNPSPAAQPRPFPPCCQPLWSAPVRPCTVTQPHVQSADMCVCVSLSLTAMPCCVTRWPPQAWARFAGSLLTPARLH